MNSSDLLAAKDKTSVQVRVLNLSFSGKKSLQWVDIACLFIEYIQLISQLFLLSYEFYDSGNGNGNRNYYNLKTIILPIAKIFSTGHLLDLKEENNKGFIVEILAVLFALCIIKYLLCFYVLIIAKMEKQGNSLAIWIWRMIVKTQSRAIYFFITSFWMNIIIAVLKDDIKISPLEEKGWVAWSLIAIILEIVFTVFTQFFLTLIIPRKDFLASKHNRLEIVNIFQKFILQMLQIILKKKFGNLWGYWTIHMMLSILRHRIYFTTLPLYKLQALFYQAICIALDLSFGISFFIQTILSFHSEISLNFAILSWIILFLLTAKINTSILDKIIINIFAGKNLTNSVLIIHRIHLIEEISNQNQHMPGFLSRYQRLSLLHTIGSEWLLDQEKNDFYINFLSALLIKFPKSSYIKLIVGYYFVKKFNMLSTGIKNFETLQNSSHILSVNAAFITSKMQKTQRKQYENSQSLLDLSAYLKHLSNIDYFKNEILKQASAQESLCKGILSNNPDLAKIFDISQFIHKIRSQIGRKTRLFISSFPEYYLEPLSLCLFYENILNFSKQETQLLERRIQKYSRVFNSDRICPENLYQHQNCCFLLSGSRETFGKILHSSPSAKQYFGQDLHEKYDYHLMMPFISSQVKEKTRIISQIKSYINKETETFCYNHKEGFIFPANCYINFYPFLGQGLNYMAIIRPKLSSKDFLVLSENGDIQGFSQNIGKTLDLFESTVRINLSKQLRPHQDFEEKIIEFTKENNIPSSLKYSYLCKMETLNIFEISMRVLTLEKLSSSNESSNNSSTEEDLEEKAEGWINFNHLSDTNKTEMGLPTSPVSTKRLLLLPPPTQNHEDETTNRTQENSHPPHGKILKNHSSKHSNSSKTNSSQAILKRMYYQSTTTKFYPRFYKPLIIALYIIFLALIAQQIAFRALLSDYLENLKAIKNVIRVAESRNNMLMEVHRHTRYIWSLGPGGLPPDFYGVANIYYFTFGFGPKVTELAKLNKKVVTAANFLDAKSRNVLFQRDVRFFETNYGEPIQQYSNMTNFQACDRIIQTGFKYQKLVTTNITQAIPYMESVMRNSLNDLLIKLTTTAKFYLTALDEQKESNNADIMGILAFTLACEFLVAVIFCAAAYRQFKSEKRNMSGFVRVDKIMVKQVLERVVQFKTNIQEGVRFDNLSDDKIISLRGQSTSSNIPAHGNRKENYNFRTQGIVLKYQKRVLQMILILTFVMILTILNFLNGRNDMNTLFKKALKVHTADQIQPKLALGQTAFVDLALKNDTTLIKNMAPSLVVANSISVIADIRNNQFASLKRDDGTYDPTIQDVLYGDACKYAAENSAYCLKISRGLENFGLVQMLVNYEKILTSVNEQYSLASIKSKDLLEDLLFEAYSTAGSSMTFLKTFTTIIAEIINREFESSYKTNGSKFNSLNTAYLLMLAISCVLIHLVLINRLKEAEDQYRKVLQTLPPNIILSNLFIKTYLKKSSHSLSIS